MIVLSLKLLLAHILGDFIFQPSKWIKDKKEKKHRSVYLYWHALIHALLLTLILQFDKTYWVGIVLITVTHLIIDLMKISLERDTNIRLLFVLDQIAHLLIIALVVYLYEPYTLTFEIFSHPQVLLFLIAVLSVTMVCSVVMKIVMKSWSVDDENNSLENAGNYIGMLERLFVFGFVVIQQWQAIGFLFAAKSVFRFNDLSKEQDRKFTEYILIGTLMSFGLAILMGLVYLNLVDKFLVSV